MSNPRNKHRAMKNADWARRSRALVSRARRVVNVPLDEGPSNECLAEEAQRHIPRTTPDGSLHFNVKAHEQWAGYRLMGILDTSESQEAFAEGLRQDFGTQPNHSGTSKNQVRRSPARGARRNRLSSI